MYKFLIVVKVHAASTFSIQRKYVYLKLYDRSDI